MKTDNKDKGRFSLRRAFAVAAIAVAALSPVAAHAGLAASLWMKQRASSELVRGGQYQGNAQSQSGGYCYHQCTAADEEEVFGYHCGIGLALAATGGRVTVAKVQDGGAADRAGLRAGDRLDIINGAPLAATDTAATATEKLKTQEGGGKEFILITTRAGSDKPVRFWLRSQWVDSDWAETAEAAPAPLSPQARLGLAVQNSDTALATTLMKAGAPATERMLDYAVQHTNTIMATALIDGGAKPTAAMLDHAVRNNNYFMAELIMDNGIAPTPAMLDDAVRHDHGMLAGMLSENMPVVKAPAQGPGKSTLLGLGAAGMSLVAVAAIKKRRSMR